MKRFISALLIFVVIMLLLASCGASSKTCPAYSNNDTEQTDGQNS